jgi:hypothetical protein
MLKVAQLVGAGTARPTFNADAKNVDVKNKTMNLTNNFDNTGTAALGYLKSAQDVDMNLSYTVKKGKETWTGIRVSMPKLSEPLKEKEAEKPKADVPSQRELPERGVPQGRVINAQVQAILEKARGH